MESVYRPTEKNGKNEDTYGLKPEVWGRVGPDPRAELQVDPARHSTKHPTSLRVASPEQANSQSSDASYHGEQGYNTKHNVCPLRSLYKSSFQFHIL